VEQTFVGGANEEQSGRTSLGEPGVVFFNKIRRHRASMRLPRRRKPDESERMREPAVDETTRKPVADAIMNRTDSTDVVGRRQARGRWTAGLAWGCPKLSSTTRSGEPAAKGSRTRGGGLDREGTPAVEVLSSRGWRRRMRAGRKS
jgi:hypothetical protein